VLKKENLVGAEELLRDNNGTKSILSTSAGVADYLVIGLVLSSRELLGVNLGRT
jgi:hypothetical protein